MKIHTKVSKIINRIIKFIDLDIKIFTDFINIILQILIWGIVYVPLLILGILALVWVVEHLKLIYVIFIPFWLFIQFCKLCKFMGIGGPIISFTIVVFLFAVIFKIKFLLIITLPILFIRYLANDLLKEHEY
ncbi:hypothetical protein Megpolyxen_01903 (plasmid) [Candidatus Megaera polyxenophila]|nr:hypothetical protein Megpolyxen_01903 [Candidatus Megaera polyxenophila]